MFRTLACLVFSKILWKTNGLESSLPIETCSMQTIPTMTLVLIRTCARESDQTLRYTWSKESPTSWAAHQIREWLQKQEAASRGKWRMRMHGPCCSCSRLQSDRPCYAASVRSARARHLLLVQSNQVRWGMYQTGQCLGVQCERPHEAIG